MLLQDVRDVPSVIHMTPFIYTPHCFVKTSLGLKRFLERFEQLRVLVVMVSRVLPIVRVFHEDSPVLLFMYSIQSSSISVVSMYSSVSPMNETVLSWSQSVLELLPSSVSPSEFLLQSYFLLHSYRLLAPHRLLVLFSSLPVSIFQIFSLCLTDEAKHLALSQRSMFQRHMSV